MKNQDELRHELMTMLDNVIRDFLEQQKGSNGTAEDIPIVMSTLIGGAIFLMAKVAMLVGSTLKMDKPKFEEYKSKLHESFEELMNGMREEEEADASKKSQAEKG